MKTFRDIILAVVLIVVALVLWAWSTGGGAPSEGLVESAWQTYRNEEFGFEFDYPSRWGSPIEKNEKVSFGVITPDQWWGEYFAVNVEQQNGRPLEDFFADYELIPKVSAIDVGKTSLDGAEAIKFTQHRNGGFFTDSLYVSHNGYVYKIFWGNRMDKEWGEIQTRVEIEKLLSTFKFKEFSQDANADSWQTYRNEEFGFELQYPSSTSVSSENIRGDFNILFDISEGLNLGIIVNMGANDVAGNCIAQEEQGIDGSHRAIFIGGIQAVVVACEEPPQREWYVFEKNGDEWLFWVNYSSSEEPEKVATPAERDLIKYMFATFKFI